MRSSINGIYVGLLAVVCAGLVGGCSMMGGGKEKEERLRLQELSAPARATVERVTASGTVDKIDKEVERGKSVYDVEATVDGKHMEYLIAADNGEVLGTESPIAWGEVPAPVRSAAEKHFGTSEGLSAMMGVEYGETHYEIEGKKNGKTEEISFDPSGKAER